MHKLIMIGGTMLALAACGDDTQQATGQPEKETQTSITRNMDFAQISRGGQLFQQNCAVCHGDQAQGRVANWREYDKDGKLPPPPLNGSAHAWHHPHQVLVDVIKNGTARMGGNMPAWKDRLSDEEINAIIAWFQSKWSDEIYAAWYQRNQASGTGQ